MGVRTLLMEPDVAGVDVDSGERIVQHRRILLRKRMIREVFFELYTLLATLDAENFGPEGGKRVEIGSGSSLLKTMLPDIEQTDIVPCEGLDRVVDAMDMPYATGSLKAVFGIHCFHHFPDPYKFLSELARVSRIGGGAILIEPYFGPIASFVYERLFKDESFDKSASALMEHRGPMSGANQALSYIVFKRDREKFDAMFPALELVVMKPIENYLRYVVSGGVNFRQFLPDICIPILKGIETGLSPLKRWLALHHVIVIRKRAL
jgi:SAM-dependent methyltransferase